jgi:dienelactone hydrolase
VRARLVVLVAAALTMAPLAAACDRPAGGTWHTASGASAPAASAPPAGAPAPGVAASTAPAKAFAVGVRHLTLARAADRPLPTTVWYPATGSPGGTPKAGAAPAPGRFPLVLFSHGLGGEPENYEPALRRWAAAGFVVAGPAYPHTSHRSGDANVLDIGNQPTDASYVITEVLKQFTGQVDPQRIGAAGHSAGGFTTVGLFTAKRDARLRAGIVIAGGPMGGAYTGPAAPLLFVHGDQDSTVSYDTGRSAYDKDPWPKAFLTLVGHGHTDYLGQGDAFDAAMRTSTDFLRWGLYGDAAARARLAADGTRAGVCRLDRTF